MSRQLLVLFARVSLMLALLLVGGCYLVAQPSIRKNEPSVSSPDKRQGAHAVESAECHPSFWV